MWHVPTFKPVRSLRGPAPSHPLFALPPKGRHPALRCGAGIHTSLRLTGENRYPWWGDRGGNASTFEPVPGQRYPHPVPTMGTASECGTTTTSFVLPVKTGIHGGVTAGGTPLPSNRSLAEGILTPVPTMGTASECGTTVWRALPLVLPVKTGIHGGVTAGGTASMRPPLSRKVKLAHTAGKPKLAGSVDEL